MRRDRQVRAAPRGVRRGGAHLRARRAALRGRAGQRRGQLGQLGKPRRGLRDRTPAGGDQFRRRKAMVRYQTCVGTCILVSASLSCCRASRSGRAQPVPRARCERRTARKWVGSRSWSRPPTATPSKWRSASCVRGSTTCSCAGAWAEQDRVAASGESTWLRLKVAWCMVLFAEVLLFCSAWTSSFMTFHGAKRAIRGAKEHGVMLVR